ncbi:hypothetical protein DCS_05862 [Drechmeria coniospora]|uniref:Uncharacterized protein n=1 Tax=Drechmeria coniospora TaxID=98403 RepID=A0A151GP04_DRECN|nr:hypothetical protein DCS_05862 [Drechmeria coniospora]KYK58844.1 hypothetical protein DCS_05862 [Drechmeria coniospora]
MLATSVMALEPTTMILPPKATQCYQTSSVENGCMYQNNQTKYYECVCGYDGGHFLKDNAECVGAIEVKIDLLSVYQYLQVTCDAFHLPVKMSQDDFLKTAGNITDPEPEPDADNNPGGISTGAKIAIAMSAIVAAAVALSGLIYVFCRAKARRGIKQFAEAKSRRYKEITPLPQPRPCRAGPSMSPRPLPAELAVSVPPPPEYTPSLASINASANALRIPSEVALPQTRLAWTYMESTMSSSTMPSHAPPLGKKTTSPCVQNAYRPYELDDTSITTPVSAI